MEYIGGFKIDSEYLPCPSNESCELIHSLLDKPMVDLENDERVQTYGLDYNILDLLCMRDDAWATFKKLI